MNSFQIILDREDLAAGLYFMQIKQDQTVWTRKLMVSDF